MCGIAGIWQRKGNRGVDRQVLSAMADSLKHRGPDDEGLFVQDSFGCAHRRLSVIDVSSAGHQPMASADGRYVIVFNGEIYNFRELSQQYLSGVSLTSASDTEVLLHLLVRQGSEVLPKLRGMFAFALWDTKERELLLARGPFGKKPLYYTEVGDTFLFGSEVKALLQYPGVKAELDRSVLVRYFLYEYVPSPHTGYANITQVPAGHYLRVTADEMELRQWWKPIFLPKRSFSSEQQALATLDEALEVAVDRRLVADVPIGIFLSGGIDSTAIAWYMSRSRQGALHSFSVSFAEETFDETSFANTAAAALSTEHHRIQFDLAAFHETMKETAALMDIPFADASLLPTYLVSKLARSDVTVVLDGDGSDELFGGYGTFQAMRVSHLLPQLSPKFWTALAEAAQKLPTSYRNFSFDFKLKSFLKGMAYPVPYRNQIWLGSFSDRELHELLKPTWHDTLPNLFGDIDALGSEFAALSVFDTISLLTIQHYLHNAILVKLDRATMFTSLEARTPFLDLDLAEFVMRLPKSLQQSKYLLKQLMRGRVPDEIINRPKKGFGIPLGAWLRGPLYRWAQGILDEEKIRADGVLNVHYVRRLLQEHKDGKADHRKKLWTLLMFQQWHDMWISGRGT